MLTCVSPSDRVASSARPAGSSPRGLQGRLVHPLGWRYRAAETTMAKAVVANAGLCLPPLTST